MSSQICNNSDSNSSQAFFFDNIRSDNNESRLMAINIIKTVAQNLGPAETLTSIFPLIQELTKEVDEDIRSALLDQMTDLVTLIGGEQFIPLILDTLEVFLSSDETSIRNKATDVVNNIIKTLPEQKIADFFTPFVFKLIENEWFTARMSAIILWPTAYKCNQVDIQERLLKTLIGLADDKIMSVRRLFVLNIPIIFSTISSTDFMNHIFPLTIDFFNDPLDSIKMSAIDSFVALLPSLLNFKTESTQILSLLRELVQDKSWRVRYTLILKYPDIKTITNSEILQNLLHDIDSLLDDREPEVRLASASIISKMFDESETNNINKFFNNNMWERIENLISNSDSDIGSTLVEQIGKISNLLSEEQYKQFFIPFLEKILRNSNPDVKLKGLSILTCVRSEYNMLQENLVEGLKDMSTSSLWRVRLSLVEHISEISPSIIINKNENDWTDWCKEMLQDEANAVREGTVFTIIELMKKLDNEWTKKFIEDRLNFYHTCNNYLLRITTIYLFERLCENSKSDDIRNLIIEKLIEFSDDKIANVRLNAARSLGRLSKCVNLSPLLSQTVSTLKVISTVDVDPDVVYFSKKALACYP